MIKHVMRVGVVVVMAVSPAMAAMFYDGFSYPDGDLAGQGGWVNTGTPGIPITVDAGRAKLTFDATHASEHLVNNFAPISANATTNIIYWDVKVFAGGGPSGNTMDIWLNDANGLCFARWYGGYGNERPRIGGWSQVGTGVTLTPGVWNDLYVEVNTATKMSTFYCNGTNLGSLQYNLNQPTILGSASQVMMGFQNTDSSRNGAYKFYDNIIVTDVPEPASLTLLALGGILVLRRRT